MRMERWKVEKRDRRGGTSPKEQCRSWTVFIWASLAGRVSDYPWSRNLAVLQGHALTKDPGVSG